MHQTLRSLAFYEGGHAVITEEVTADAARFTDEVKQAVSRFERRLVGLQVCYVAVRLEGVVVYRRDAITPTGRWDFSDVPRRPS